MPCVACCRFRLRGVLPLVFLLLFQPLSAQNSPLGEEFDHEVSRILSHWSAPGVVVSVVKDGAVLFQGGYGSTKAGGDRIPDGQTLAPVQSVTKPFTSIAVGMLVDDGVLDWDEPIRTYIPEFEFGDPLTAQAVTLRDLLTHRSGLPNVLPGGFFRDGYRITDLIRELSHAQPEQAFRDYIHYSQTGLGVVGEVISRETGMSWSEFVQARLLGPLGMDSSFPNSRRMIEAHGEPGRMENLLLPAVRSDGEIADAEWTVFAPAYCPAACIVATAGDMTRFLLLVLNNGVHDGTQLLSPESLREITSPHTVRLSGFATAYADLMNPLSSIMTWGMGWGIYEALDQRIIEHPGSGRGSSVVALVPDENLGVFISTNATYSTDSDDMVSALKFLVLETVLDLPRSDWINILESKGG